MTLALPRQRGVFKPRHVFLSRSVGPLRYFGTGRPCLLTSFS
jgi:hypothetical protein